MACGEQNDNWQKGSTLETRDVCLQAWRSKTCAFELEGPYLPVELSFPVPDLIILSTLSSGDATHWLKFTSYNFCKIFLSSLYVFLFAFHALEMCKTLPVLWPNNYMSQTTQIFFPIPPVHMHFPEEIGQTCKTFRPGIIESKQKSLYFFHPFQSNWEREKKNTRP